MVRVMGFVLLSAISLTIFGVNVQQKNSTPKKRRTKKKQKNGLRKTNDFSSSHSTSISLEFREELLLTHPNLRLVVHR